jgi:flagellar protein FlbD
MIAVTRLDGADLIVNAGHVVLVERTPDTVIELTTGQRIMVKETVDQVVSRVVDYRQRIASGLCRHEEALPESGPERQADDAVEGKSGPRSMNGAKQPEPVIEDTGE